MSLQKLTRGAEGNQRSATSSLRDIPLFPRHRQLTIKRPQECPRLPELYLRDRPAEPEHNLEVGLSLSVVSNWHLAIPRIKLGVVSNKLGGPQAATQNAGGPGRQTGAMNRRGDQDTEEILKDVLPHCVTAAALGSNVFGQSIDGLRTLVDHIGTGLDTYGCRAKLHSLRDAMSTLLNHTS